MKSLNREKREQYEQGGLQGTLRFTEGLFFLHGSRFPPWRGGETLLGLFLEPHWNYKGHSVFRGERENSLFVENLLGTLRFFAIFACFAVKFRFRNMNREQRERREQRKTERTNFRGFRAFRG